VRRTNLIGLLAVADHVQLDRGQGLPEGLSDHDDVAGVVLGPQGYGMLVVPAWHLGLPGGQRETVTGAASAAFDGIDRIGAA